MQTLPWDVVRLISDRLIACTCPVFLYDDIVRVSCAFAETQNVSTEAMASYLRSVVPDELRWSRAAYSSVSMRSFLGITGQEAMDCLIPIGRRVYDGIQVRELLRTRYDGPEGWVERAWGRVIPSWLEPHVVPWRPNMSARAISQTLTAAWPFAQRLRDVPHLLALFMQRRRNSVQTQVDVNEDFDRVLDMAPSGTPALKWRSVEKTRSYVLKEALRSMADAAFVAQAHRRALELPGLLPGDMLAECIKYVTTADEPACLQKVAQRRRGTLLAYASSQGVLEALDATIEYLDDDALESTIYEEVIVNKARTDFQRLNMYAEFDGSSLTDVMDVRTERYLSDYPQWFSEWHVTTFYVSDYSLPALQARSLFDRWDLLHEALGQYDLELREDSAVCRSYVLGNGFAGPSDTPGDTDLQRVVQTMLEMRFLFDETSYSDHMRVLRDSEQAKKAAMWEYLVAGRCQAAVPARLSIIAGDLVGLHQAWLASDQAQGSSDSDDSVDSH